MYSTVLLFGNWCFRFAACFGTAADVRQVQGPVVDVPVEKPLHMPMVQTVQNEDQSVQVPALKQVPVPHVQTVENARLHNYNIYIDVTTGSVRTLQICLSHLSRFSFISTLMSTKKQSMSGRCCG